MAKDLTLYLDLDGVLADFPTSFFKLTGKTSTETDSYQAAKSQLIGTDFFANIEKFTYVDYLIKRVVEIFGDYRILSAPLIEDADNSRKHKLIWIANNLPIMPTEVVLTKDKAKYATPNSILVDDHSYNTKSFTAAGGIGIDFVGGRDNVADLLHKLKELKKEKK